MRMLPFYSLIAAGLAAFVVIDRLSAPAQPSAQATSRPAAERWVYCPTNLAVPKNVENLQGLFARAGKAGYNRILLSDTKLARLGTMGPDYFKHVEQVKAAARANGLEIVPAVFPLGYSEALLYHDPNLAEGLPVREARFEVRANVARLLPDPAAVLPSMKDLGKWSWKDPVVTAEQTPAGPAARMSDPKGQNARLTQKLKLTPFRQYHVSVRVKTRDFKGTPEIKALSANGQSLIYSTLGVKPTQDWTTHHAVFNSLDHSDINLYFGAWGAAGGTVWWADAKLEEIGPVNLLRRPGAPLVVRRENGGALAEGRDFEPLADPRSGTVPWPGAFEVYHAAPELKTRNIPDGTQLRVSYYHAVTVYDGQVMICPSEPKTVELLRDEARRVHAAFGAKGYFMSHDEIRVLNWCAACESRRLTPGAILADNVKTCAQILRAVNPGGRIYVWSDMFDPHHNAVKNYYLVHGTLEDSWLGLDKDIVIGVWYLEKARDSMTFFADRGHRMMIAGYYDAPPQRITGWLEAARAVGREKVTGVMYTTWQNRYTDLEAFAGQLQAGGF